MLNTFAEKALGSLLQKARPQQERFIYLKAVEMSYEQRCDLQLLGISRKRHKHMLRDQLLAKDELRGQQGA